MKKPKRGLNNFFHYVRSEYAIKKLKKEFPESPIKGKIANKNFGVLWKKEKPKINP